MESVEIQLKNVVERMRAIRIRKSMSQLELSLEANLSQSFLACVESGKKQPSVMTLLRIAKALKVNPSLFFLEEGNASWEENPPRDEIEEMKDRIIKFVRTL
jgi:transcriptional regulator with XRE-family HTH domain